jgi:hypothetical protein
VVSYRGDVDSCERRRPRRKHTGRGSGSGRRLQDRSDLRGFHERRARHQPSHGWHGGIFIGGNRDGVVGWQTEFNWLRRAGDTPLGEGFHIDYLQVPILLRFNIGTNSKNGFAIYGIGGPAFEFKIADEINGVTIDDAFEGTDVGFVVGAGMEITRLILEGRYEWGFLRINKAFADVEEIKTRSFTILVGIRFN